MKSPILQTLAVLVFLVVTCAWANPHEVQQWLDMLPPKSRDAAVSGPSLSFKHTCFQSREDYTNSILATGKPLIAALVIHLLDVTKQMKKKNTLENMDLGQMSTHNIIAQLTGDSDMIVDLETLYDSSDPVEYADAFVQACSLSKKACKVHMNNFMFHRKELGKSYKNIKFSEIICPFMSDVKRIETLCDGVNIEERGFVTNMILKPSH